MREQPIKRNRYFDRPSTECSLNGETYEQDTENFHLRSAQAELASLHNWGIVQGLEVSGTLGNNIITINGGVALDAQGRLIVLATEGRGDLGTNPPGNNHELVSVPVEFNTSSFAATSYYLTIQFSEYTNYNDPGSNICGRLEQAPWLRLQPVSGFTDDGTAVVLAVVTLDSSGNIVALAHQDSSLAVTRHLSGKTVGQLQIRRSRKTGNEISETNAATLEVLDENVLQFSILDQPALQLSTPIRNNSYLTLLNSSMKQEIILDTISGRGGRISLKNFEDKTVANFLECVLVSGLYLSSYFLQISSWNPLRATKNSGK